MTYLRKWEDSYILGLSRVSSDYLRNRVRSTTVMLAGNPYMHPSVPVEGSIRAILVSDSVVLVYELCSRSILKFLQVCPRMADDTVCATARRALNELRAGTGKGEAGS